MDANNAYEQEIDLKDLLFAVLYKWRMILVIAVLFAALLGGYRLLSTYRSQTSPAALAEAQKSYQKELDVYNNSKEIAERDIDKLTEDINVQMEYLDNSILMNISPYSVWEAKTAFFVKTDYKIMPDMMYQDIDYTDTILQSYALALSSTGFLKTIADDVDIELRYLSELITITSDNKLLTLQVHHNDEETVKAIMSDLVDGVKKLEGQLGESIGPHELNEVSSSVGTVVDLNLAASQEAQQTHMNTLNDSLEQKQEELDALTEPKKSGSPMVSSVKNGIKYGVLGGVLGAFMVVFFVCVAFLMSDKLYSAKQLKSYCNVKILGALPLQNRSKFVIDRWLSRLEGRAASGMDADEYDLIAANILNYAEGAKNLMVTGTAEESVIAAAAEQLKARLSGIQMVCAGSVLQSSEALRKLPECDGVILVEQCKHSAYGEIKAEVEKASDLKKPVIGCVVFE